MIGLLLALALPAMAQQQATRAAPSQSATSSADSTRVDAIDIAVQALQSGKPVFTSTPTFRAIAFGDGTVQTTAASASAVNYGPTTWTQGAISEGTKSSNQWQIVGSTYVVAQASVSFVVPSFSSASWRIYSQGLIVTGSGTGIWKVRFQNDSGSNYLSGGALTRGDGTGLNINSNNPDSGCSLFVSNGTLGAGDEVEFRSQPFRPWATQPGYVSLNMSVWMTYAVATNISGAVGCRYKNASSATNLTTISIVAGSGTGMTGWIKLEKLEEPYSQ